MVALQVQTMPATPTAAAAVSLSESWCTFFFTNPIALFCSVLWTPALPTRGVRGRLNQIGCGVVGGAYAKAYVHHGFR